MVPKNTKLQVANVKEIVNLLPTVSKHILEAMDEVARTCLDILTKFSDTKSKTKSIYDTKSLDQNQNTEISLQSYHKLEVRTEYFIL